MVQIARKDGLLALERVTIEDPFMSKGINYYADGAETDQIKGDPHERDSVHESSS